MLLRRTNRFLDYCESLPGQGLRVEVVQVLQVFHDHLKGLELKWSKSFRWSWNWIDRVFCAVESRWSCPEHNADKTIAESCVHPECVQKNLKKKR